MTHALRFRQIHLDFHTHELIPAIGSRFDPEEFAATLERARVDSINLFARCHHGWIYFDTRAFPERRHPQLTRNLLKEQIEACHARGIRAPIYTTIQWDHFTATRHPEWLVVDERGCPRGTPTFQAGFYRQLCLNTPYKDFIRAHVQEILETLPVDGFWFDILLPPDCACRSCREGMRAQGMDPTDPVARRAYGLQVLNDFQRDLTAFVRQYNQECLIFYNGGHVGTRHRPVKDAYTHFELESLPSGGWGYLDFPATIRYARTLGLPCLGMTGKFHTSWGDFHSLKNRAALEYECFRMLALNAQCSIGDQLHPSGKIDPFVYELVGAVYSQVERKEPWCRDAQPLVDIGVFTPEEFVGGGHGSLPPAILGITRMLEEGGHQFDVLDSASDLTPYKVVVLPDAIPTSPELAAKLEAYLAAGGALIASFESGMDAARREFVLGALGVRLHSEGARASDGQLVRGRHFPAGDYVDYLLPRGAIGRGLPETEHVMYMRGVEVTPSPDAEVLADGIRSYFDRTWEHFCSHRQTPSSGQVGTPAIVRRGRAIYFAHPVFTQYNQNAPRWCKVLFLNALDLLLPEPLVRHDGPSTLQVTVNAQPALQRLVVHLLHYIPERRGNDFDVIEDVIPLHDVRLSLRVERPVRSVRCAPEGATLPFVQQDGRVEFVVPKIVGHQMVEVA